VKRPGKFAGIDRNLVLVGLPLINPSTNAQKGDILPGYRLFQVELRYHTSSQLGQCWCASRDRVCYRAATSRITFSEEHKTSIYRRDRST
jgi:hypothetical protein